MAAYREFRQLCEEAIVVSEKLCQARPAERQSPEQALKKKFLQLSNRGKPGDAAGIDVGSREHHVAVPGDRDPQPVRCFGTFTSDLHALADWLLQCGV